MQAISGAVLSRISELSARDIANTAFSFATLRVLDQPLSEAFSSEVLRKIEHVEPQSLAFLTEVGLGASCHPTLVAQLERIIARLLDALPKTLDGWRRGVDLRNLKDVRIDHLGSVGTHLVLTKVGVPRPDHHFIDRAAATFPRGPSGDFSRRRSGAPHLADNTPQQRRIFAYAEYQFVGSLGMSDYVEGRMLREHGFQGLRMWQKGWLKAVTLPVNPNVDRSVCAEFQVFNELCDLVHQRGLSDSMEECSNVFGKVAVLVSTTPCLSCVCAMMQYSLLFPHVQLEVGCVQPWHAVGGAAGALEETPLHGEESVHILPAIWEGGQIVRGQKPSREEQACHREDDLLEDELEAGELTILQDACRVKLGGGRHANVNLGHASSWRDVREALAQSPLHELAEVLRGHRQPVQGETLPARIEKVLKLFKELLGKDVDRLQDPPQERARSSSLASRREPRSRSVVRWRIAP
mmetsp:Transcript_7423/g.12096  ORF Transcript_7423/g.12096 Transcript_7423/m.12096 type:complete len:466 (-) Transcript_7423:29-1426(-)